MDTSKMQVPNVTAMRLMYSLVALMLLLLSPPPSPPSPSSYFLLGDMNIYENQCILNKQKLRNIK
jgi:hypothetical protein